MTKKTRPQDIRPGAGGQPFWAPLFWLALLTLIVCLPGAACAQARDPVRPVFDAPRATGAPRLTNTRREAATVAPSAVPDYTTPAAPAIQPLDSPWRIRIFDVAVVDTPMIHLGQIAEPVGTPPPGLWDELASRPLWPAPAEPGKPMTLLRAKMQPFLREALGAYEPLCLYPGSIAIQSGGAVMREDALRALVVKNLTGYAARYDGEVEFADFRLPPFIFLANRQQQVAVLTPATPAPGRVSLTLAIKEMDGSIVRRFTGTVQMNVWREVPVLTRPVGRDEVLEPGMVTFVRRNLATLKGEVWDGRGGPFRLSRSLPADQTLMLADLARVPAIRKGSRVTLVYARGAVRLSVPAEALNDAGPGESVTVRNLQSNKEILATAQDSTTAVIR